MHPLYLLLAAAALTAAQGPQTACYSVSGSHVSNYSTAFSACSTFQSSRNLCNANDPPRSAFLPCICNQQFLDNIYDCESETTLCLGIEGTQNQFDSAVADWHSSCDTYLSTQLTTPQLSTLTTTRAGLLDPAYCHNVRSSCRIESNLATSCSNQYPAVFSDSSAFQGFSRCFCQESIIRLASVCHVDGNVTCIGTTAALTEMFAWNVCPMQANQYLQTHSSAAATASLTSLRPIESGSAGPGASGSSSSPGPTGSSPVAGNAASRISFDICVLLATMVAVLLAA